MIVLQLFGDSQYEMHLSGERLLRIGGQGAVYAIILPCESG